MSETIRDQALKAALSILDSQNQIAFINYRYGTGDSSKPTYVAKISPDQIGTILKQQEVIIAQTQLDTKVKLNQTTQQTIDNLLSSNNKIGLGAEAESTKKLDKIFGVIMNPSGNPSIVEIVSIFGYSQLAGLQTTLDNLQYLISVVDPTSMQKAVETENSVVNAITNKLQATFSTQYAQQLLGDQGYNEIVGMLDKP